MDEERRAYPRLSFSVPLAVHPIEGGQNEEAKGLTSMTRNISAGGVYFSTLQGESFRPGMQVALKISMPHHSIPAHKMASFSLVGKGTVVRIDTPLVQIDAGRDREETLTGVAVKFDESLRFENFQLV